MHAAAPQGWTRRRFCAVTLACPAAGAARAAPWPDRPVRLWVAYAPGGVSGEIARTSADLWAPRLGVPVIVEHRPGAGGLLAMEALAREPGDGHVLCFAATSTLTVAPHYTRVRFDPLRDIAPVIGVMHTPLLVVATRAWPGSTWPELVAHARARPGELRWATSGTGTLGHLVWQQVCREAGVSITHIPYKGGGQQIVDALGGQFELLSTNLAPAQLRHVAQGHLRPLAIGAPQRAAVLPQLPTLAELGHPSANLSSTFGMFAPGRTPGPLVARLHLELAAVLRDAAMRERLAAANNLPADGGHGDFAATLAQQAQAMRGLAAPPTAPR